RLEDRDPRDAPAHVRRTNTAPGQCLRPVGGDGPLWKGGSRRLDSRGPEFFYFPAQLLDLFLQVGNLLIAADLLTGNLRPGHQNRRNRQPAEEDRVGAQHNNESSLKESSLASPWGR